MTKAWPNCCFSKLLTFLKDKLSTDGWPPFQQNSQYPNLTQPFQGTSWTCQSPRPGPRQLLTVMRHNCIGTWTVLSTPQSSLKRGISLFQTINPVRGLSSQFRFFSSHLNCLGTPHVEVQPQHVQGGEQLRSQRGPWLRGWHLWAHCSTVRQAAASAVSRLSGSAHQRDRKSVV